MQLPIIRLKKIVLVRLHKYNHYLHLCALHPDLQVMKLVISLDTKVNHTLLSSVQEDLTVILKMPSLQKISLLGDWGHLKEVKTGLMQGLYQRACLYPLRKITLEALSGGYDIDDFRRLWDAVFSLPRLEQLKIVLEKGFTNMTREPQFNDIIYEGWVKKASKILVNTIVLTAPKTLMTDYRLCPSFVTQNYCVRMSKHDKPTNSKHLDLKHTLT